MIQSFLENKKVVSMSRYKKNQSNSTKFIKNFIRNALKLNKYY